MIAKNRARVVGLFIASDVLAIILSYLWSYLFRFNTITYLFPVDPAKGVPAFGSYLLVLPLFIGTHMAIFFFQGFYKSRLRRTKLDDFFFISLNAILTILVDMAILNSVIGYSRGGRPSAFGFRIERPSLFFLILYFVGVIFAISILRNQIYYIMKRRYARGINLQNVLVVGAGEMGLSIAQKLYQYKDLGFVVKGFLADERKAGDMIRIDGEFVPVLGGIDDISQVIEDHNVQEIYVALDLGNYPKILETIQIMNKYPVSVRLIPDLFQLLTLKANIQDLDGFPVISIDDVPLRGVRRIVKRMADFVISGLGLLFLSPFFLILAALIKLTSKGPIWYHQERVGVDGKHFIIHKFRTMICDAEKATGPVMSRPTDPRITRIGRLMRKYSLDELPQLVNVFRGKMSLVGPRPERPEFVKEFTEKIPKYMLRHKMKSGITGWAQVHGLRQGTSIEKRLEHDFYYIQNWSFALDLKILWMTFRKGFIDKSIE
ncbi:MAG: undecaprenyl-phosphate glucose phosphotransferase [Candidatus Aminicenantales bacterium]